MASKEVGNLRTKLSWEDDGADRSLEGFKRDLKGLRSEMKYARSGGREYTQSLKGMREQSDILTRRLKTQREQVQELRRRYEESARTKGESNKQTQNLADQYRNASAQMNMTEDQLKRLNDEIRRQESSWTRLGDNLTTAGDRMQQFGRGMTNVGRTMTMRVTTPILGIGAAALTAGANFEEGMSKVEAISGATGDELQSLEDLAKDLGATTRFSATEAAGGMEYLAMAGFETNEILESMPGLLDLAASSGMDLSRAADIASNVISGFGYEASDAGRVADVLAEGAATANTNVEQLGGAMQYVAPVANTLGLEIEGMTAAVGFMSDAGIQGQQAGRMLRQGFLRLADPTGEAATLIEDLGINVFDAEGEMKEMHDVVAELENGLDGMDSKTRAAALSTLFGTQSTAGWSAVLERGSDDLEEYTGELEDSEGAAGDMADTMRDNAKGAIDEMKSSLEGAAIEASEHLIPILTDAVEWVTDLVRQFGELDEEQQKQILKWAGIAAAAGPAALILGNVFTVVGGIAKVAGGLATTLGRAGGAGLIARLGMLGPAGIAGGVAVAGLGLLGAKFLSTADDGKELEEVSLDNANAMMDQKEANDEMIDNLDALRRESELSNDEFGRYLDIQKRLESETNPKAIELLKDEAEKLKKESGLSNDEFDRMVGLNDTLVDELPGATGKITDQGSAIADTTSNLKDYNQELANMALAEMEEEVAKSFNNQKKLIQDKNDLQLEHNILQENSAFLGEIIQEYDGNNIDQLKEKVKQRKEEVSEQTKNNDLYDEQSGLLIDIQGYYNKISEALDDGKQGLFDQREEIIGIRNEKEGSLEDTMLEIEKNGIALDTYQEQLLVSQGFSREKANQAVQQGTTNQLLDDAIQKEKDKLQELKDQTPAQLRVTDEYQDQVDEINNQISGLENVRDEIDFNTRRADELNGVYGQDIDKNVNVNTIPSTRSLNESLRETVGKRVNIDLFGAGPNINRLFNAEGHPSHPGGPGIVGEEGWELARLGNKWTALNAGLYDIPRGTEIFPHDESKKMINALKGIPQYADGARPPGESNRVINDLNNPQMRGQAVIYTTVINQMDGRELSRQTYRHVTEFQDRDQRQKEAFR